MEVKRIWPALIVGCLILGGAGFCRAGQATTGTAAAYFPEKNYIFDPVLDGTIIIHDFIVQNKGFEKLLVERVATD